MSISPRASHVIPQYIILVLWVKRNWFPNFVYNTHGNSLKYRELLNYITINVTTFLNKIHEMMIVFIGWAVELTCRGEREWWCLILLYTCMLWEKSLRWCHGNTTVFAAIKSPQGFFSSVLSSLRNFYCKHYSDAHKQFSESTTMHTT